MTRREAHLANKIVKKCESLLVAPLFVYPIAAFLSLSLFNDNIQGCACYCEVCFLKYCK